MGVWHLEMGYPAAVPLALYRCKDLKAAAVLCNDSCCPSCRWLASLLLVRGGIAGRGVRAQAGVHSRLCDGQCAFWHSGLQGRKGRQAGAQEDQAAAEFC